MSVRRLIQTSRICLGDVGRLYVEARTVGLDVSHYPSWGCHTFDGLPLPDCDLGVFRTVGTLIFYKTERRWEVRARSDCTANDLATLIRCGLAHVAKYGRNPGHYTRKSTFTHRISGRTGKSIAWAHVCYKLGVDDLLLETGERETVDLTATDLLSLTATSTHEAS